VDKGGKLAVLMIEIDLCWQVRKVC